MSDSADRIDRRTFLGTSGMLAAGAAVGTTALSYARILGANDRIALGHIGVGEPRPRAAADRRGPQVQPQRGDDRRL